MFFFFWFPWFGVSLSAETYPFVWADKLKKLQIKLKAEEQQNNLFQLKQNLPPEKFKQVLLIQTDALFSERSDKNEPKQLLNVTSLGQRIQSSRSTSSDKFILLVMVEKMRRFCLRSGSGNSIFLSKRPGRSRAGSRVSALLVAMITWTQEEGVESRVIQEVNIWM